MKAQRSTIVTSMFLGAALAVVTTACAPSGNDAPATTAATASAAPAAPSTAPTPGPDMAGHSAGSMELHRVMTEGAQQASSMAMSGDVDKDFASMMSMHHRDAIRMAEILLQHGQNAELKAMAKKMVEQQRQEIEQLAPFAD